MPVTINSRANVTLNGKASVNESGTWIFPFNMSLATIDSPDSSNLGVNLGVVFRSDYPGYIKQIRFWKTTGNTGTHEGTLWTSGGVQLADVIFSNETASGWQYAKFPQPVFISANTTYVASYHVPVQSPPNAFYISTGFYFTNSGEYVKTGNIYAVESNGPFGPNGLFHYSNSVIFPDATFHSTNYWVDVYFDQNL